MLSKTLEKLYYCKMLSQGKLVEEEVYNCRGVWFKAVDSSHQRNTCWRIMRNTFENFWEIQLAKSQKCTFRKIIIMISSFGGSVNCIKLSVWLFDLKWHHHIYNSPPPPHDHHGPPDNHDRHHHHVVEEVYHCHGVWFKALDSSRDAPGIHPKNWLCLLENSAENSNFPQKDCLI